MKSSIFKKTYLLSLSFIVFFFNVNAGINDIQEARRKAVSFFADDLKSGREVKLSSVYYSSENVPTPVFAYQKEQNGYVVLIKSGEEFIVAAYSETGVIDLENTPDTFWELIHSYEKIDTVLPPLLKALKSRTVIVSPLLDTKGINFGQTYHLESGSCAAGCVATAMAQIMAFHQHPQKGTGMRCYTHRTLGEKCVNYDELTFDWDNMNYTDLQYYIGVGMDMDFCGPKGSAPARGDYYNAMEDYFGYFVHTQNLDFEYWKNELNHGRPFYAAILGQMAGHAVVVDGYDSEDYFHINFGWRGVSNGYFLLMGENVIDAGSDRYNPHFLATTFISTSPYVTNEQDSLALIAFHNSMNGQTGWDITKPVIKWPGVTVINERVIRVKLVNLVGNVTGTIPPEIGELSELRELIIFANIENIPDEIGLLHELNEFQILGNVNGAIPATITNLSKLKRLDISKGNSDLYWELPEDINRMSDLEYLYLPRIASGKIPESIGMLQKLRYVYLSGGSISGELPKTLGNMHALEEFNLNNNQIQGAIPETIGNLSNVKILNLNDNNLSGPLPESLFRIESLGALNLSNNNLSGEIPDNINLPNIFSLLLSNNHLEGEIPPSIQNAKKLHSLKLESNKFSALPEEIGALESLRYFDISENRLSAIPDGFMNIHGIWHFNASNNLIEYLPDNFGAWRNLTDLDLSHNKITTFPKDICYLTNLESVDLSYNKIRSLPPVISMFTAKSGIFLSHNEISGKLPVTLINSPFVYLTLGHNRYTFEDLPPLGKYRFGLGDQNTSLLQKSEIKAVMGDTLYIDIRELGDFYHPDNIYYWFTYPEELSKKYTHEVAEYEEGPILVLPVNENNISKKYYCKIFNPNIATHDTEYMGSYTTYPLLRYLNTDTLSISLYTEEELVEKLYPESYVVESKKLHKNVVYDNNITLVPPAGIRGEVLWQGSLDGETWHTISEEMDVEDIKNNVVEFNQNELVLSAQKAAYFRSTFVEGTCDPIYTDSVLVKPLGNVLFDGIVNVTEESLSVSVDSIEVILPVGICDEDFRLTITKLDNPPAAPDLYTLSSVYDVTVSFGSAFNVPLKIILKNIDVSEIDTKNIPNYKPVFYDDKEQKWIEYREGGISLEEDAVVFHTPHLTKLGWWEVNHGSYTHRFIKDRVEVIYKWGTDTNEENSFLAYQYSSIKDNPPKPWHSADTDPDTGGTPYMIQDVAQYLNQVIDSFAVKGLSLIRSRFTVYVSNTGTGAYGHIGVSGYARGYFTLNAALLSETDDIQRTIAHEYMHYMQQFYMMVLTANTFWAEANAPLAGRLVWNNDELINAEPEVNLKQSYKTHKEHKSIFDLLGASWDAATSLPVIEKFSANQADANLSSTFLHYMQTYREGTKLNPVQLLTKLFSFGRFSSITWRNYLNDQINSQLESNIGKEYDEYVRYLIEGTNKQFTVLDRDKGKLLSYIIDNAKDGEMGSFAMNKIYEFANDEDETKKDEIAFAVPYLASKMLVLTNKTSDRAVVVNYTKKHKDNEDGKIYYGKYDFIKDKMTFTEISDSTKFSFLLEPNSQVSEKRQQNFGFLLFVNQKCPSVVGLFNNFNVSFDLEAMPVVNIYDIADARVSDYAIHNYSDGKTRAFIMDGNFSLPQLLDNQFTTESYNSYKEFNSDSTYTVFASFMKRNVADNGANLPMSITIWEKDQEIKYDFINGEIDFKQNNTITYRFSGYYRPQPNQDEYIPPYTRKVIVETRRLKVKNVTSFEAKNKGSSYGDVLEFSTNNTEETKNALIEIYDKFTETRYFENGELDHFLEAEYINTDFSSDNIQLEIKIHNKLVFAKEEDVP